MLNLTPHDLTIIDDGEPAEEVPPSGATLRVEESGRALDPIEVNGTSVPVEAVEYGALSIEGGDVAPADIESASRVYVSGYVAQALEACDGKVAQALKASEVYTAGELVRGDDGRPVGVASLERVNANG